MQTQIMGSHRVPYGVLYLQQGLDTLTSWLRLIRTVLPLGAGLDPCITARPRVRNIVPRTALAIRALLHHHRIHVTIDFRIP
jgi:hypothetical protein